MIFQTEDVCTGIICIELFVCMLIIVSNHNDEGRRDRMVVGFTTTFASNGHNHYSYEFEHRSWRDVLDTTLCDKVCQWLATCRWFFPGTPFSSNKTDRHDMIEIFLKVALNTKKQNWWGVFYILSQRLPHNLDILSHEIN